MTKQEHAEAKAMALLSGAGVPLAYGSLASLAMLERAMAVLEATKRGRSCWCEMAIGNPMVTTHSPSCEHAQALLREWEG